MKRPLDINGNPVIFGAWYWARNRTGQTVGTGKFLATISRPNDVSFYINGAGYEPSSFAAFAKTDDPFALRSLSVVEQSTDDLKCFGCGVAYTPEKAVECCPQAHRETWPHEWVNHAS